MGKVQRLQLQRLLAYLRQGLLLQHLRFQAFDRMPMEGCLHLPGQVRCQELRQARIQRRLHPWLCQSIRWS